MSLDPTNEIPYSVFSHKQKVGIISIASATGLLSPFSSTLYVPALSAIASDLHVSIRDVNLTITTYLILQGIAPMFWGAISDSLGRRQLYVVVMLIYIGSCTGLAITNTYAVVMVFRALQAAGSAPTLAIGLGLIGDIIPSDKRGGYIGNYSALAGLGTAVGPVLGGILAEYTGWHSMFYFLTAFGAFMLLMVFLFVPETLRSIVGNGSIPPPIHLRPPLPGLSPSCSQLTNSASTKALKKRLNLFHAFGLLFEPDVFCSVAFTGICFAIWQMCAIAAASLYVERYHLNTLEVGLTYVAHGVGSLAGSVSTGRLLNRDYQRHLKHEKESAALSAGDKTEMTTSGQDHVLEIEKARIGFLAIPMVAFILATVGFGWAMHAHTHVSVPIILGFFLGGVSTMALATFCE